MKAFIATAIASLLCLCTFRVPLVAQVARNPNAIDVHLHAMHPENFSVPASANFGAVRKTFGTNERDPEALLRRTIAEMDKNHVSKGIISGDDDVVAKWVERYPNRFLPSYNHWCDGKPETVAKLESELKAGKWKAIGELGLPYGGHPLNDPACFPLFELAQRYDIPVFFHTGLGGPNPQEGFAPKFRISLSDPVLLEDVAVRFPKLKIVIAHMGWPFYDHALYMLFAYENVYLDTAIVNWILGKQLFNRTLEEAVDTVGSDRILFGTDQMVWPQMITPAVESIRDAPFLSDQDKRNILGENARRLLKIAD
jgi:predicted TIM-barrel fold metal-dependent hydrolase